MGINKQGGNRELRVALYQRGIIGNRRALQASLSCQVEFYNDNVA